MINAAVIGLGWWGQNQRSVKSGTIEKI